MSKGKSYHICLISSDLHQANIIKKLIGDFFYDESVFFAISDISSIDGIKNHIILLDYNSTKIEKINDINTSDSGNSWFVINIPESCLLSASFWIDNGFCGIFYEHRTISNLVKALNVFTDNGEYWYSRKELSSAIKNHHQHGISHQCIAELIANQYQLTHKERDVLFYMLEGLSNQQIATHIYISVHTVKNHVSHIMSKIGVSSRKELLAVNFN
ncbi:response regulator transcription factor [Photobacterium minamisatsumaniensis]|uniref:response regulator transcription factor n=1 Tax=Photobacterium minamisatsumaniensis TaxID=2910233 RepID=UPI003D144CDE